jgi:hypothetical protein
LFKRKIVADLSATVCVGTGSIMSAGTDGSGIDDSSVGDDVSEHTALAFVVRTFLDFFAKKAR